MNCCRGRRSAAAEGDPHGWNSLQNYYVTHRKPLEDLDYFVLADDVSFDVIGDFVHLAGRVHCTHGLFIDVAKTLDLTRSNRVKTRHYAYHAGIAGDGARVIFRYDNFDQKHGHGDRHHCHRFDPATWQEIQPPVWIGVDRWPHLSDAIEELADWWDEIGRHLRLSHGTGA
jgi:hypothetical protein